MKLLNLGCGGTRHLSPEWLNVDDLYNHFPHGHPERELLRGRLDAESNYLNMDISNPWWPGYDPKETINWFDGILCSHVLEHFDAQETVQILRECYRCLKPGGTIRVSVPDAAYFRQVYPRDCRANWPELFEEPNDKSDNQTYFAVALYFHQHKQVMTFDTLWCHLVRAGFEVPRVYSVGSGEYGGFADDPMTDARRILAEQDNRRKFSIFAEATK